MKSKYKTHLNFLFYGAIAYFLFYISFNMLLARLIYLNLSFAKKFLDFALEYCSRYMSLDIKVDRFSNILVTILLTLLTLVIVKIGFSLTVTINKYLKTKKFTDSLQLTEVKDLNINFFKSEEPQAFAFGIFKKRVYISTWFQENCTAREIDLIIRHELAHLEGNDYAKRLILEFILGSFLLFPFKNLFYKNFQTIQEISSDSEVVRDERDLKALCAALYKSIKSSKLIFLDETLPAFATNISRVDALLSHNTYKKSVLFISQVFTVFVFAVFGAIIFILFATKEVSANVVDRYPSLQSRGLSSCVEKNYSTYYNQFSTPSK